MPGPLGYPGDATQEDVEQQALLELVAVSAGTGAPVTISAECAQVLLAKLKEAGVELPTHEEMEEKRKAKVEAQAQKANQVPGDREQR